MQAKLIDLLACPSCGEDVHVTDPVTDEPGRILEGSLECVTCRSSYPIVEGIPRMLLPDQGRESTVSFEGEFSLLETDDLDMDPYDVRRFYFFSRSGIDPDFYSHFRDDYFRTSVPSNAYKPDPTFLRDKAVLDAGCGPGRFTEVAAREGAGYVVGLDLGLHVDRAASRCRGLDNVDFVQGSVLHPPFRTGAFEYVFSIGVLHHTGDARRGFGALSRVAAASGAMSVMVYGTDYWGGTIRGWIAKRIHRRMSQVPVSRAYQLVQRWLYPLGMLQMKVARVRFLKFVFAPLFLVTVPRHPRREVMLATILDYYTPHYISTHTPAELTTWARAAGFTETRILPVATSCFARRHERVFPTFEAH